MRAAPSSPGKESGYSAAAKRLSGWAANLLATGLILVAGLALGRQVLQWWRADAAAGSAPKLPAPSSLGNPERPHLLEFGDLPFALRRTAFVGSKESVFAILSEQGREAVSQPPQVMNPPGPEEERMLARIDKQTPVAQEPGEWEMYQLDGPILMVCGVRFVTSPDEPNAARRRVVFWGLGVLNFSEGAAREPAWTLLSFSAGGLKQAESQLADISLPAGARGTMSTAADDGARLVGFRGEGDSAAWRVHFERHFSREGWLQRGGWREADGAWYCRFEKSAVWVDVQWSAAGGNELAGLITVTPQDE